MNSLREKFASISTDYAPGQEARQGNTVDVSMLKGETLSGEPVDFSHGDVNSEAFGPTPGSLKVFMDGVASGGTQAYTEYRGREDIRAYLIDKLGGFTGPVLSNADELIITPGTQGALFLAMASNISSGDKVAIVNPDYFANRKIAKFLGAEVVATRLTYLHAEHGAGLDLSQLESAFKAGCKVFVFSNPNNPTGVIYSREEIGAIAELAERYGATVIVDQLYSRLIYPGYGYTHLRATNLSPDRLITIMGPSKTESLSGYRLGVAFSAPETIERMEKLQAIVSLRAPGYCQAVLRGWFSEPSGWLSDRIVRHQRIRDDITRILRSVGGLRVRDPEGGSYVFPRLPALNVSLDVFVKALRHQGHVIVTPGTEFDPLETRSIRLNFSQTHRAAIDAVERLSMLIGRYRT
jgi:aspartate/methionine/tyrosine aminotransferase